MKAILGKTTLELVQGDITLERVDAIVNAANNSLLGGGGVDGAIHRAAGPQLLAETHKLGGCATGDARISGGYRLPARHVIHTVGPIYRAGDATVPALLASAYRRSLEVAFENGVKSIAFPSISTGVYGYPLTEAAPTALATVCDFVMANDTPDLIRFVLFDARTMAAYHAALHELTQKRSDLRLI